MRAISSATRPAPFGLLLVGIYDASGKLLRSAEIPDPRNCFIRHFNAAETGHVAGPMPDDWTEDIDAGLYRVTVVQTPDWWKPENWRETPPSCNLSEGTVWLSAIRAVAEIWVRGFNNRCIVDRDGEWAVVTPARSDTLIDFSEDA